MSKGITKQIPISILTTTFSRIFVDGNRFVCKVNCAADAGDLVDSVPFALCVSLEVAEGVGVEVYQEMHARISPQVQVAAAGG